MGTQAIENSRYLPTRVFINEAPHRGESLSRPWSRQPMRVVILGNAGSGKTTLARWLAERARAERLDLDSVAWEPGQIAVSREPALAQAEVEQFCRSHERWVV